MITKLVTLHLIVELLQKKFLSCNHWRNINQQKMHIHKTVYPQIKSPYNKSINWLSKYVLLKAI